MAEVIVRIGSFTDRSYGIVKLKLVTNPKKGPTKPDAINPTTNLPDSNFVTYSVVNETVKHAKGILPYIGLYIKTLFSLHHKNHFYFRNVN